jgi:acyl carrier protein
MKEMNDMTLDMNRFQIRLLELTEQLTEQSLDETHLQTPLVELGVDSLMALELAVYFEREFGIRLTEEELSMVTDLQVILDFAKARETS